MRQKKQNKNGQLFPRWCYDGIQHIPTVTYLGSRVRISKHKNIFSKGYHPNCFEEIFLITKVKNIVRWTYVIHGLNGEEVARIPYKKSCKLQNK